MRHYCVSLSLGVLIATLLSTREVLHLLHRTLRSRHSAIQ